MFARSHLPHPFAPASRVWPQVRFAEPPFLFRNDGEGFTKVAPESGEALARPYVGRGVATGDYDNDGDPDVLLLIVSEPPRLLRNDGGNRRHWIGVELVGTKSARDALEVRWPSGHVDRVTDLAVDRYVTITEGEGLSLRRAGPGGEEE